MKFHHLLSAEYFLFILLSCELLLCHGEEEDLDHECLRDCVDQDNCDCSGTLNLASGWPKLSTIPGQLPVGIQSLDLSCNNIHNVTTIPELNTLEKIDLANNSITNIQYDAFDNLDYVYQLILSNNSIEAITEDIFEWNPLQLKVLRLDNNKLEFIQHFLFYDLDQLMELDLSHNQISFIHPHAFGQQKRLLRLNLSGNKLYTLKPAWFKSFSTSFLESIEMTDNPISCDCALSDALDWVGQKEQKWFRDFLKGTIKCASPAALKDKILWGKGSVHKSDVNKDEYCKQPKITKVSRDTSIRVGQNIMLQCIAEGTPHATIDWRSPQNDIYNFHNADHFDGIHAHSNGSLVIMDLQGDDFGNYTCIATNKGGSVEQVVHITQDKTEPPADHPKKPAHHVEDVDSKDVDKQMNAVNFTENSDHCHEKCSCRSRRADCSSQAIEDIPQDIPEDTITYNLAGNKIKHVGLFGNYPKLVELSLDDNAIEEIEAQAFKNLAQLQTLTLRNNRIRTIKSHTFQNLKKLTILVLDHNELESISESYFKPFEKLQWLYVRNNNIKQINSGAFSDLQQIKFIHMENNALPNIPASVVKDLVERDHDEAAATITRIFVDDNPFMCDCQMEDLHHYITNEDFQKHRGSLFGEGIKCRFPAEYGGMLLEKIDSGTILNCNGTQDAGVVIPIATTDDTVSSSALTAMWFGGVILGVLLCVVTIFLSKRYGRRLCGSAGGSARYSSIAGGDQSDYASLTANSGGSEAFI